MFFYVNGFTFKLGQVYYLRQFECFFFKDNIVSYKKMIIYIIQIIKQKIDNKPFVTKIKLYLQSCQKL